MKKILIVALPIALSACQSGMGGLGTLGGHYGMTHVVAGGATALAGLVGGTAWGSFNNLTECMESGAEHKLQCDEAQDVIARNVVFNNPEPRYIELAKAVEQCDQLDAPHCDQAREVKLSIDDKITAMRKAKQA